MTVNIANIVCYSPVTHFQYVCPNWKMNFDPSRVFVLFICKLQMQNCFFLFVVNMEFENRLDR